MSAGWVAGCVRARALASRRIGRSGARALAERPTLAAAVTDLTVTPYRFAVRPGQSLEQAQHALAATLLWNLRVLAGWLPAPGARLLRILAAGFEIANVDELRRRVAGRPAGPTFTLGALATAWPRLSAAQSPSAVDEVLATSAWGPMDPDARAARCVCRRSGHRGYGGRRPKRPRW